MDLWRRKRPWEAPNGTETKGNRFYPKGGKTAGQVDESTHAGRRAMLLTAAARYESMPCLVHHRDDEDDDDALSAPVLKTSSCSLTEPTVSTTGGKQQQLPPPPAKLVPASSAPTRSRTFANFTLGRGRSLFGPASPRASRRERRELRAATERMAATRIVAQDDAIETRWNRDLPGDGFADGAAPTAAPGPAPRESYRGASSGCRNHNTGGINVIPETVVVDGVLRDTFSESCFDEDEEDCAAGEDWDMEDAILFVNNEFTVLEFTTEEFKDVPAQPTN